MIEIRNNQLVCDDHLGFGDTVFWCDHLKDSIASGDDGKLFKPEESYYIPIFPTANIFADIVIGEPILPNGGAEWSLRITPDIGRPKSYSMGYWNPGEGVTTFRSVIVDWMKSKLSPSESFSEGRRILSGCPSGIHGMFESNNLRKRSVEDHSYKLNALWLIVTHSACPECVDKSSDMSNNNFGIDESLVPTFNRRS